MKTTDVQEGPQEGLLENKSIKQSLLSADDWAFIKDISDKFPDRTPSILQRFQWFEAIPAKDRIKHAQLALKVELRRGFTQRMEQGIIPQSSAKDIESIHEHAHNMRLILRRMFNRQDLSAYGQRFSKEQRKDIAKKAFRLADIHDMPEAITTDFTPDDLEIITREDKGILEGLAARIIFETFPKKHMMIDRYEEKDQLEDEVNIDHLNKVIDFLEGGVDCLAMNLPVEAFDEWTNTIETGLKKYPELSMCFASAALTKMRRLRPEMDAITADYPTAKQRREYLINRIF